MGSNSVNTGDMVMFFSFCNSPHGPLSVYQVSINYLKYFLRYALDKSVTDGQTDIQMDGQMDKWRKWQLYALPSGSIKINALLLAVCLLGQKINRAKVVLLTWDMPT